MWVISVLIALWLVSNTSVYLPCLGAFYLDFTRATSQTTMGDPRHLEL